MYRKVLCIKDIFLNDICWFTWVWTFLAISFWFIWVWIYFDTYWSLDFSWDIFLMILSDFLKFVLFLRYLFDFFWVWIYLGTDSSLDFLGHISLSGDLLEFGLSWRSSVSWSGPLTVPLGLLLPQKLQEQKDNLSS